MFVSLVYSCHDSPYLYHFGSSKPLMHTNFMIVTTTFVHVHLGHQNSPYTPIHICHNSSCSYTFTPSKQPLHTPIHDCHNSPCSCTFRPSKQLSQHPLFMHFWAIKTARTHSNSWLSQQPLFMHI